MTKKIVNFRQFAQNSKPHYSDTIDTSIPMPDQVLALIEQGCLFPNQSVIAPIIANYLILPSALMEVCPILFLCGKQGSGKSQVGLLASKLHKSDIFSAASTFAGIRNSLTTGRIKRVQVEKEKEDDMPSSIELEKNIFLIWDDLDPALLVEEKQLYRILKNGYNRSTAQIQISSEKVGTNLTFNCFSPKLISSVTNLCLDVRFRELARRCLLIETQTIEDINAIATELDSEHTPFTVDDLQDFSQLDWDGFNESYHEFWDDIERLERYADTIKTVDKRLKSKSIKWTANQISISREIIAIGLIADLYLSLEDAIDIWTEFWQLKEDVPIKAQTTLLEQLEKALKDEMDNIDKFNTKFHSRLPYSIKNSHLNNLIEILVGNGSLIANPSALEVKKVMLELGWYPSYQDWLRDG